MHIYSVNDPEFKSYGNVWDDVPSEFTSPVLEALSATPIPEGSKYVASAPELEGVKDADKLGFLMFGGRLFQLGWCNGHNTRLNCLEYHRASEFNLGAATYPACGASLGDRGRQTRHRMRQGVPRAGGQGCRGFQHHAPLYALHGRRRRLPGDGGAAGGHQRPAPRAAADMPAAGDSYCYWKADKWFSAMLTASRLPRVAT